MVLSVNWFSDLGYAEELFQGVCQECQYMRDGFCFSYRCCSDDDCFSKYHQQGYCAFPGSIHSYCLFNKVNKFDSLYQSISTAFLSFDGEEQYTTFMAIQPVGDSYKYASENADKFDVSTPVVYLDVYGNPIDSAAFVKNSINIPIIQNFNLGRWDRYSAALFMKKTPSQLKKIFSDDMYKNGVIIDLEFLTLSQKAELPEFLHKVSEAYKSEQDGVVIVALSPLWYESDNGVCVGYYRPRTPVSTGIDYKAVAEEVDYVLYMAIDQWPDNYALPVASYYYIETAVANVLCEVPVEKLILELATYGKVHTLGLDVHWSGSEISEWIDMSYLDAGIGRFNGTIINSDSYVSGWVTTPEMIDRITKWANTEQGIEMFYFWDAAVSDPVIWDAILALRNIMVEL